jgi:predicted secreted protein
MSRYILGFLIALVACAPFAIAQPDVDWTRFFGGEGTDKLYSLQIEDIPSALLLAGCQQANPDSDANIWLVKTDMDGLNPEEYIHAWDEEDVATACVPCPYGYFIGGYTESQGSGDKDFYLEKMFDWGQTIWTRTYGGPGSDACNAILPTSDRGCIMVGQTNSFGAGGTDVWLVSAASNGDSLWSRTYGGPDDDYCAAIVPASDGGYYLAGTTESFGLGLRDFWLMKTNANGDSLWSDYYGGSGDDWCFSAQRTADGGLILAGYTNSFGTGHTDVWLVKTDENGVHQWNRTYNGRTPEDFDGAFCVQQTTDGGYIMTGSSFYAPGQHSDIMVLRVNANGDSLWSLFYGGAGMDVGHAVQQTSDGGFLVLCYLDDPGQNAWLIRLNPEGAPIEERPLFAPRQFTLSVFPNPFNPRATICFDLPRAMMARLSVFDMTGRLVTTLADAPLPAGTHRLAFDGSVYPSGVYFAHLQAGDYDRTEKLILLK